MKSKKKKAKKEAKKETKPKAPSRTAALRRRLEELLTEKHTIVTGQTIEVDYFELKDLLDWVEAEESNLQTMGKIFRLAAEVQFPAN